MDMAFIKVLNMSISASWLVLIVLVLRLLLKKSPKWISVALWALVAVRLVCPFSIESALSLMPSTQTVPEEVFYMEPPRDEQNVTLEIVEPRPNGESLDVELDTTVSVAQTRHVLWTLLWPAGMAVMLTWALISYSRLRKKVAPSIDVGNGVFICDYIDTPFILGIGKPKIYLPSTLEPDAASHVLAHERAHIARKDHWWKPFGYLLLSVHWFNPLLWLAYILLCRDIELACDEKVIRDMAIQQKKAYSEALLSCSVSRRQIAACPLAFGEVGVKERVKTVLNYKKPAFWIVLVAIIALIVTAVCFLTDPRTEEPEVTGESPYGWTSTVGPWDIQKAWAYPYEDATYLNTIEGNRLDILLTLLNAVQESEIIARKPSGKNDPLWNYEGTTLNLYCSDGMSVFLRYVDDTVIIGTETDSGTWEVDGYWVIENENLTNWLERIANGGTHMLSDENREEIRWLLRMEDVQFFDPREHDDLLFVGCAYDNGRGLGVAVFEPLAEGYKLLKLIRDEDVKRCASGSEVYYCDHDPYRIFLILNQNIAGMEWAGVYENAYAIETHPGLVVEYFPEELDTMYRFNYGGGATTMYMDWNNQTHVEAPAYAADNLVSVDDAYRLCSNLKISQLNHAWASIIMEVDNRYSQAYTHDLTDDQIVALVNMLHSLPEEAYERAEFPQPQVRGVDIFLQNETGFLLGYPVLRLEISEGAVYYQIAVDSEIFSQAWRIDSPGLLQLLEAFYMEDISAWNRFAPVVKTEGEAIWAVDKVEITVPNVTCFRYEASEEGIRFKPEGEDGWVLLQYRTEPYAADEHGLRTFAEVYGGKNIVRGCYGDHEHWNFMDITVTSGDVAWNVLLLNEDSAPWVAEYDEEISAIIHELNILVRD